MIRYAVHGRMHRRTAIALAAAFSLSAVFTAAVQAADISIDNATAHVRHDAVNGSRVEVYMSIENAGAVGDRLYAVRSKMSGKTMLSVVQPGEHGQDMAGHADMAHGGMKHLRTAVLELPAGETTVLRHGGSHIMLMEPKEMPAVGATFPVILFFERAGRFSVEVTVQPMDMDH